ncbi:hypothetical protein SDC9_192972 [bioreactor metagenome]|uniref:Uncharacterized protein n=1 Tax=bioreactor metagenome TaxID=1076179 RepID=A0A645I2A6_9ZZZZ
MDARFLFCDRSGEYELLNQRMIGGDGLQGRIVKAIHSAVSNVSGDKLFTEQKRGDERCPHAVQRAVLFGLLINAEVGFLNGLTKLRQFPAFLNALVESAQLLN